MAFVTQYRVRCMGRGYLDGLYTSPKEAQAVADKELPNTIAHYADLAKGQRKRGDPELSVKVDCDGNPRWCRVEPVRSQVPDEAVKHFDPWVEPESAPDPHMVAAWTFLGDDAADGRVEELAALLRQTEERAHGGGGSGGAVKKPVPKVEITVTPKP